MKKFWTLLILLLAGCATASACTCVTLPAKEALKASDLVFHGKVIKVSHLSTLTAPDPKSGVVRTWIPERNDFIAISLKVDMAWKGEATTTVKVLSVLRPDMCDGLDFDILNEYLIYVTELPTELKSIQDQSPGEKLYHVGYCPLPTTKADLKKSISILGGTGKKIE